MLTTHAQISKIKAHTHVSSGDGGLSFHYLHWYVSSDGSCCFVVLVALRPMSTAMVIAGRSVHLTTLFPGQA